MVLERSAEYNRLSNEVAQLREQVQYLLSILKPEDPRTEGLLQHSVEAVPNFDSLKDVPVHEKKPPVGSIHTVPEDVDVGTFLRADGFRGATFEVPQAEEVAVDASSFSGVLSGTDTDVQKALDTIDGISVGTGDVVGPASAVADNIATYNGITGKRIKDGGVKVADLLPKIASSTNGNLAAWDGTGGNLLKDSGASPSSFEAAGTAAGLISSHEGSFDHTILAALYTAASGTFISNDAKIITVTNGIIMDITSP